MPQPTRRAKKKPLVETHDEFEPKEFAFQRAREHPSTRAISNLSLMLGGLGNDLKEGNRDPLQLGLDIANNLQASIDLTQQKSNGQPLAQPPPADFMAMFRLADFVCRNNGDVWQSIAVPGEIILKQIDIEAQGQDDGAKRFWEEFWHSQDPETDEGGLNVDRLYEDIYYLTEQFGQSYPLEVWDNENLSGIAFVEPTSMWVGQHIGWNNPYSLMLPEDFELEKLKSMMHDKMYSTFVTDQNIQTIVNQRIPIPNDAMRPVYAQKAPYARYAVPHIARATRSIMHRMVLEEYQRGTIEDFLNQLWVFIVGTPEWPATPQKMKKIRSIVETSTANHSNSMLFDHAVQVQNFAPKSLDSILGTEIQAATTQQIFRDLGFSMFIVSGEIPGVHGRGGGSQVEIDVQFAIERWKHRQSRFIRWAKYIAKKRAMREKKYNGKEQALLKHLPEFIPGAISVEQVETIKSKLLPLLTVGLLDRHTGLKDAGYNYDQTLKNKQAEQAYDDLFKPPASFSQTVVGNGGGDEGRTTSQSRPAGRTPDNLNPRPNLNASIELRASLIYNGVVSKMDEFSRSVDTEYMNMVGGALSPDEFGQWLASRLRQEATLAYQDGFTQWGGLGEQDYNLLDKAPQGLAYHLDRLNNFIATLKNSLDDADSLLRLRTRANQYVGTLRTAHMLGVQQAYKSHGATHWQRILHPELSVSGPCKECIQDSLSLHGINEPFFEFHPSSLCAARSMQFFFSGGQRAAVRIPDFVVSVMTPNGPVTT